MHRSRRIWTLILLLSLLGQPILACGRPTTALASAPARMPAVSRRPPALDRPLAQTASNPSTVAAAQMALYEYRQTLTSAGREDFRGARTQVMTLPDVSLTAVDSTGNGATQSQAVTLPPGARSSLEFDLVFTTTTPHWLFGFDSNINVTHPETGQIVGITWQHSDIGPYGTVKHFRINLPTVPDDRAVTLTYNCTVVSQGRNGTCAWLNQQVFIDVPGWHMAKPFGEGYTEYELPFATRTSASDGIAPIDGSYLSTTVVGGWGVGTSYGAKIAGPWFRMPALTATDQITLSLDWARVKTPNNWGYDGGFTIAVENEAGANVYAETLPSGGPFDGTWAHFVSNYAIAAQHMAALSGAPVRFTLSLTNSFDNRAMAIDRIQLWRNGQPLSTSIADDQAVGKCLCNVGGIMQTILGDPVNTKSGAFYLQATDLALPAPGPSLVFARSYVSLFADTATVPVTALGPGWRHAFDHVLTLSTDPGGESNTIIYEAPSGNRLRFRGADFVPAAGVYGTLTASGGGYTLTLRDGTVLTFAAQGTVTTIADPQGRTQTIARNGDGTIASVTDTTSSRALTFGYTTVGGAPRLTSVSDGTRTVGYGYDSLGRLTTVTDVRGGVTTYAPSGTTGRIASITDPIGRVTVTNTYDAQGRVQQQLDAQGVTTTYTYTATATGQETTTTQTRNGLTHTHTDVYRADGSLAWTADDGQFSSYVTYDGTMTPTTIVDANQHATQLLANPRGMPIVRTDALGNGMGAQYDAANRPIQITDPRGILARLRYDALGQVISTTVGISLSTPLGLTALTTYSGTQVQTTTAPDGVVTRYASNTQGQVTSVIVGDGTALAQTTTYGYDALGRLTDVTSGAGTALARIDRTVYNPDNTVQRTIANYQDGVFSASQPTVDLITRYGYDALGRPTWVQDPAGRYTATAYTTSGQVSWTAQNFVQTGWTEGALPTTPPAVDVTQPDRNWATLYGYDGLGRTTLVTATGILTGTFNRATLTFAQATTRTTRTEYDGQSRPVTVTLNYRPGLPASADTNVQLLTRYDAAGNPTQQRDALGRWTVTTYDALNRPLTITQNYQDGVPQASERDTDLIQTFHYDAAGQMDRTTDLWIDGVYAATAPDTDRVTQTSYDTLGRVTSTTTNVAAGLTTTDLNLTSLTSYDATTGRTISSRDAFGQWTSMQYDARGRVLTTIANCRDSGGQAVATGCAASSASARDRNLATRTSYDGLGRAWATTQSYVDGVYSAASRDEDIRSGQRYDGLGRVISSTLNLIDGAFSATTPDEDVTTRTGYDVLGRTVVVTDAVGAVRRTSYDGLDRVATQTDAVGRVTTQGAGGRWSQTPDGRVTVTQIDGLGRAVATIQNYQDGSAANSPADEDIVTRTVYDVGGRRLQAIDALGRVTQFAYDLADRLTGVTENLRTSGCAGGATDCNLVTTSAYDRAGNRVQLTDARGNSRSWSYDAADRELSATDALGRVTATSYDVRGLPLTINDARDASYDVALTYDALGRPLTTQATNLGTITNAYDALGRRTSLIDPTGTTSFSYDALGRMTGLTAPSTGTIGYGYSARGERTQLTYPGSGAPVIDYSYTDDGQLSQVKQGGATRAAYRYDPAGRLSQVGRLGSGIPGVTNYRYDRADRLVGVRTDARGTLLSGTTYTLDRAGRRTSVAETAPGSATPSTTALRPISFEAGLLIDSYTGGDSRAGMSLDTSAAINGQYAAKTTSTGSGQSVQQDLTAASQLYGRVYVRLDVTPTADAPLLQLRSGTTVIGTLIVTTNRTVELRNGSTLIGTSAALTIGTVYRLGIRQSQGSGTGVLSAWLATGETAFGSPFATSTTQTVASATDNVRLGSPGTGAVLRVTVDDLALDTASMPPASGVAATRTIAYGYDGVDRLTSATATGSPALSQSFSYDAAGNRVVSGVTYNAANQRSDLTYDLTGNVTADGASTSSYDALNRLTSRTASSVTTSYGVNGDGALVSEQVGSGTVTRYTQDLAAPLSQILSDGTTSYIYGADRLFRLSGSTRTWELHDGLGSVTRTSSDAGVGATPVFYEPFGAIQSGTPGLFGFTGERQNGSNVYLRARWYNASSGTFTARDPFAGYAETPYSLHPYAYGYSNPISNTDPTGMCVPGLDRNCRPFWDVGQGPNWADSATYWNGVAETAISVVTGPVQLMYGLVTDADTRAALQRGAQYAWNKPGNAAWDAAALLATPFTDIYQGIVCGDSNQLGRGLTGYTLLLGGGRLWSSLRVGRGSRLTAEYAEDWWTSHKAVILNESNLRQLDPNTCVGTCARMIGLSNDVAEVLENTARSNIPRGLTMSEASDILTSHGIEHTMYIDEAMVDAMPIMQRALRQGRYIIGEVTGHAVVVRSVEKIGLGPRDYLLKVSDPATGRMIQLGKDAWTSATDAHNSFIVVHE